MKNSPPKPRNEKKNLNNKSPNSMNRSKILTDSSKSSRSVIKKRRRRNFRESGGKRISFSKNSVRYLLFNTGIAAYSSSQCHKVHSELIFGLEGGWWRKKEKEEEVILYAFIPFLSYTLVSSGLTPLFPSLLYCIDI